MTEKNKPKGRVNGNGIVYSNPLAPDLSLRFRLFLAVPFVPAEILWVRAAVPSGKERPEKWKHYWGSSFLGEIGQGGGEDHFKEDSSRFMYIFG